MAVNGWVGLLRAVNLGARNKVPMADLRRLCEEVGCESVRTYIQSGNVLFTHASSNRASLAKKLERAVADTFGVDTPVVLRKFDGCVAAVRRRRLQHARRLPRREAPGGQGAEPEEPRPRA